MCVAANAQQQNRIVERTYISTDRTVYVSGEDIWCSAFCLDVTAGGVPSRFSSIAYVELIGESGQVATSKIALQDGRGASRFHIPSGIPTGNYRLVAYTAVNRNEKDMDYMEGSRLISVYNTLSRDRTSSTVISSAPKAERYLSPEDTGLRLDTSAPGQIVLENTSGQDVTMSLSVYAADCIPEPESLNLEDFVHKAQIQRQYTFTEDFIPEYDGEVIRVRVPAEFAFKSAFISSPGNPSNFYSTEVDEAGMATFFTGNIYGETNMVFQVDDETGGNFVPEVQSPFVTPAATASLFPVLYVDESFSEALLRRSIAMQLYGKFGTELLAERIPERPNLLFSKEKVISYNLDDYRRFPTMRETIFEFVKKLSVRKGGGKLRLKTELREEVSYNRTPSQYSDMTLAMVDGVPVTDHELIVNMDPNSVQYIDIYPYAVSTGSRIYGGVVNFRTYRGDLASIQLPENVKMLDFSGCSYPSALRDQALDETYPDYRQTLIWEPIVDIKAGESVTLQYRLPNYKSHFWVAGEGVTSKGCPVHAKKML